MMGECAARAGARPRPLLRLTFFVTCVLLYGTLATATRLRHSRHLDVRSQFPDEEELPLNENYNHKPVFVNCANYAPMVDEEMPRFSYVFQVHAEDKDPPEDGGTITYKFVTGPQENVKFEIDNVTGVINTTTIMDRDEPIKDREFYLTVLATDNGRPQLDDVCTFKVTIRDINDNEPVFDKVAYTESVPQDLPVDREVMRVSASDPDDGDNATVRYNLTAKTTADDGYFRIDRETGIIYLTQTIKNHNPGYRFGMVARAMDLGTPSLSSAIDLDIRVVESHKKAPIFLPRPLEPIKLRENFSDFDASIVRLKAISNVNDSNSKWDNSNLLFELVVGSKEQTNKLNTFRLESNKDVADIKISQALDYESNTQYSLIVRVQNKNQLAAETVVDIEVLDVNDIIPTFRDIKKGSVLENEPPGVPVMQVRAIDLDGTSANNQVRYELDNFKELFAIDSVTGNITTLVTFDREVEDTYDIKVIAMDNSPSALFKTGEPNKGQQVFRIEIGDKNDNPPRFTQKVYTHNSVDENANINTYITQVEALDSDTASPVTYSIIAGNTNGSFSIERTTGKIRVNQTLDYEQITKYNLTVKAFDGVFNDTAQVEIFIENVNDNPPVFREFNKNPTIEEEKLVPGCITTVEAYDPDIEDRNADQHIAYFIVKEIQQPLIDIDKTGCMKLKKPLDRDPPNGYSMWTVIVMARDEDGSPTALRESVVVNITLLDINDNAPFLDMPHPVIWGENQSPGKITELKARDYDSDENGPPFQFRIDSSADEEIKEKFDIHKSSLFARVQFDREQRKSYDIPIAITDSGSPSMTGTSTLTVIIGDENDNPMQEGSSSIFVYNYKGESPNTQIGRVYVNDPDDWDLPDKSFDWAATPHEGFFLDTDTGMITLLSGTSNDTFVLKFIVTEKGHFSGRLHQVSAYVNVTVKELPEEAVERSGSVRFYGINAEQFVEPDESGVSRKEIFQEKVASMLNISVENVDVFTVLHSPHYNNRSLLDVRFSAHGSPYYAPEKLNTILAQHSREIEREMRADILLVNIDECLFEKLHCNNSCRSYLNASTVPYPIYTNTSSFVGVRAVVDPQCTCHVAEPLVCLNGGTPLAERCECPPGLEGRRCELLSIGFHGDGWAIMPPPGQACEESHLGLEITPHVENSLVFYFGPMTYSPKLGIQDFMALELQQGYAVLYIDYGTGTARLDQRQIKLTDGKSHRIDVLWTKTSIELKVDNCAISACLSLTAPVNGPHGTNEFLNVNGPMQIGGTLSNLAYLASKLGWDHTPTERGFVGCIRNMSINGNTYNLGMPSISKNADPGCNHGMAKAVSFGIDTNFLVAILVCVAILLILLLAVVVQRRKTDDMYKDMDDIRENIINYEDEGGGEVDTGYDLNVLRAIYDAPPIDSKIAPVGLQGRGTDEVPDICGFLDGKKESCDKDPDTNPFDDVRHYAYEGEGNSEGDLSSLASCTDDGDLKFNYLSNFGPRFRKLADMYGEEPSDEDSDGVGERESESWC
ncbi:PREDICTED: DE-cadherin isoform X2 [Dinoponera quadriceps]|uniref:DE-cadherin isoform X2 n=1 Tax=Dinoponera quadriceps TaxID=609295 RepID=A0A6P3WTT6_DINQU|nr:PREDICTED: DE-cadherin isoform X2 [Dinoponera quadriceps]